MFNRRSRPPPPVWGLFGLFLVALAHAVAYSPFFDNPRKLPAGLEGLTDIIPLWILSAGWLLAALGILVAIVRRRRDWAAVGLLVTMLLLWGLFYGIGWVIILIDGGTSRTYLSCAVYIGVALYVMGNVPYIARKPAERVDS